MYTAGEILKISHMVTPPKWTAIANLTGLFLCPLLSLFKEKFFLPLWILKPRPYMWRKKKRAHINFLSISKSCSNQPHLGSNKKIPRVIRRWVGEFNSNSHFLIKTTFKNKAHLADEKPNWVYLMVNIRYSLIKKQHVDVNLTQMNKHVKHSRYLYS